MAFQKKPRILIIDDDEEYLEVVKKYLEKDCIPYIAQGGRAAIDFLRHQKADMILLDVEMPIFDGFHTLLIIAGAKIMLLGHSPCHFLLKI